MSNYHGQQLPQSTVDYLSEVDKIIEDAIGTAQDAPCKRCGIDTPHVFRMNEDKGWLDNQCQQCSNWWLELNPPNFP